MGGTPITYSLKKFERKEKVIMAYAQWNNKAALIGRIANEVEMKKTPNGNSVVNINLAVEKNKDQTDFFPVSAWGNDAEYLLKYACKGALISAECVLSSRKVKVGEKNISRIDLTATGVHVISKPQGKTSTANTYQTQSADEYEVDSEWLNEN